MTPRTSVRGFTLLELLVIIALVGIISSILLTMLNQSRMKTRDGRRISDIKQIQVAVALYESNKGVYPYVLEDLLDAGLMPVLPKDPVTGQNYAYFPFVGPDFSNVCTGSEACTSYHLGASLEDSGSSVLRTDADSDGGSGFIRGDDLADCEGAPTGNHCYDLRP